MIRYWVEVERMLDGRWTWRLSAEHEDGRRGVMGCQAGFPTAEMAFESALAVCKVAAIVGLPK